MPFSDYKKKAGSLVYKLTEAYYDFRFGISTNGFLMPDDFGKNAEGCHAYLAISYRSLKIVLSHISYKQSEVVLIDFGSGMGRVPIFAATFPFKRVIGVELSKQLNDIAVENVKRVKNKLVCKNIDMVEADAREYKIPSDANVFYFFMPFNNDILQMVLQNIYQSVKKSPRDITILYAYPTHQKIHLNAVKPNLPWLNILEEKFISNSVQLMIAKITE
jgi:16S rRNA G966 N2-methylase RsmD